MDQLTGLLLVFVFVLARLLPTALLFPVVAGHTVPLRMRLAFAVLIALMITPIHGGSLGIEGAVPLRVARELVLGLGLALSVVILVGGLKQAGSIISQISGQTVADVDPGVTFGATPIERFFALLAVAVFLAIGGHRMVVEALLDSFQWVPPGAAAPSADSLSMLADLLRHSFDLAIRAAAPVAFSVLMSTLLIGLLSKALPQVGTLGFGLGINFAVVLVMTVVSLGGVAWLMELHLATGFDRIVTEISKANLAELVE